MPEPKDSFPTPSNRPRLPAHEAVSHGVRSDAFDSPQLSLFQDFLCNKPADKKLLSNTIALWDSVPRYSISRNLQNKLRTPHGMLDILKLGFQHNKLSYVATITPARVEIKSGSDKGKTIDFYPSATEELVEDALRKLAADQQQRQGFFDKNSYVSGVAFSLYQLQEELAKQGHTKSYREIVLSLEILHKTNISIATTSGGEEHIRSSTYFPALASARRKDLEADPSARWVVQFHPLVTQSIDNLTYRQFNYHQLMSHRNQLSRWIHKQLVMKYTFAALGNQFKMKFSTIQRDSALLTGYKHTRQAIVAVTDCFEELQQSGLLTYSKGAEGRDGKKLVDVEFIISPSPTFVREVKAANKRQNPSANSSKQGDSRPESKDHIISYSRVRRA